MSDLRVEVRRTKADIFQGVLENTLHSPASLAWIIGGAVIVALIAAALNSDRPVEVMLILGALVFAVILAVNAGAVLLCVVLAARTSWSSSGALEPVIYTFLDEGLHVEAASGHGLSRWETWKAAFETKALIVVRHQLNFLHILPKRGLGPDVLNGVRSVLSTHIKGVRLHAIASETAA